MNLFYAWNLQQLGGGRRERRRCWAPHRGHAGPSCCSNETPGHAMGSLAPPPAHGTGATWSLAQLGDGAETVTDLVQGSAVEAGAGSSGSEGLPPAPHMVCAPRHS